jgi:hypothetical protein
MVPSGAGAEEELWGHPSKLCRRSLGVEMEEVAGLLLAKRKEAVGVDGSLEGFAVTE